MISDRLTIQISGKIATKLKKEKKEFDTMLGCKATWTMFLNWREEQKKKEVED